MCCDNLEPIALPDTSARLPRPEIVESIIREVVRAKYGEAYEALILNGLTVDSIDSMSLILHTNSSFRCAVIQSRLVADIERVMANIYGIYPAIFITVDK